MGSLIRCRGCCYFYLNHSDIIKTVSTCSGQTSFDQLRKRNFAGVGRRRWEFSHSFAKAKAENGPLSSTRVTSKHPLLPLTIFSASLFRLLSQLIRPVALSLRSLLSVLPPPSARFLNCFPFLSLSL